MGGEDGAPFEIQIRTADMHFVNEYGLAAHWQYKESSAKKRARKNKRAEQQIAWNRWLVTWQMELQDRKFRPSGSPDNPKDVFVSFPEDEPAPPRTWSTTRSTPSSAPMGTSTSG